MLEHPSIFKYSPQGSENLEVRTISREDVVNFIEELESARVFVTRVTRSPLFRPMALGIEILW